jgi:hypothetical protein
MLRLTQLHQPHFNAMLSSMGLAVSLLGLATCTASAETGRDSVAERLASRPLPAISLNITPVSGTGADGKPFQLPVDVAAEQFNLPLQPETRGFVGTTVQPLGNWNFCYQPLLFEEVNAERYGVVCRGLQPGISAAKFYARTFVLPLSVVHQRARQPGYFPHVDRPGYGGIRE